MARVRFDFRLGPLLYVFLILIFIDLIVYVCIRVLVPTIGQDVSFLALF